MHKWLISIIILLALATVFLGLLQMRSCSNILELEPDKPVMVHSIVLKEIEGLGKMELMRYQFQDVVAHEVIMDWWPDPKVILSVQGEAVGCIDFTKIDSTDIRVYGDSLVVVTLPPPEICYSKLDHDQTKVFDTENTFWSEADLVADAYRKAEDAILTQAVQNGILVQTQEQAITMLEPLLQSISGKKVKLRFDLPQPSIEMRTD